jgi:cysteinyl-tRNA synthetase
MSPSAVRLYNTMTQRLEPLTPIDPGHVRLYLCGPTTYDHAHAGHARTFVAFDVLVRFLRVRGYRVTFVRNVTDVDDKILQRARDKGEAPLDFSRRMGDINADELRACGCLQPDFEPRVSENIGVIIQLIEDLVAKGAAYAAPTDVGRDVYFAVRAFPGYGKLSHRVIDELVSGARVEPGEAKRDPLDFALWKASADDEWGWDSPWGRGRPGWHVECSAMAAQILSPHFDVHCGGMDLIFPHHENEIAQSEAAWGAPFARLWVHSGFLNVDAEKMSKSLGNFVTIGQILERNDAEALRYFVLGAHYRGPLNFDVDKRADGRVVFPLLDEAERRVEYLYSTRESLRGAISAVQPSEVGDDPLSRTVCEASDRVIDSLDNDLNTSVALSVIAEVARIGNETAQKLAKPRKGSPAREFLEGLAAATVEALDACCRPLGLMQATAEEFFARTRERRLRVRGLDAGWIAAKVDERSTARAAKDFGRSDGIRDELARAGVELQDELGGGVTTWRVVI